MTVTERDVALFARELRSFIPPKAFDAHAHLYDPAMAGGAGAKFTCETQPAMTRACYDDLLGRWMGDSRPVAGLFTGFPHADADNAGQNRWLADQIHPDAVSRALMLVSPADDPATVEAMLDDSVWAGFKVYHCYADCHDTFNADCQQFMPEWIWELADGRDLAILLHIVKPDALGNPSNQRYIREHCVRYPGAKLILAHAARGFCGYVAAEAIASLRGLDNVFFDSSGICESAASEAVLRTFGPTRLFFGLDMPIAMIRGKAVTIADGFLWTDEADIDWSNWRHGQPTLAGIESLLALKQACRATYMVDRDVERIFCHSARAVLGLESPLAMPDVQEQYRQAKAMIPGGTQLLSKRPEMFAPDHWPAYYEEARGCEVIDTQGRKFIDMSSGGILACILGYADPDVNAAVMRRVQFGSMATQQTFDEVELAKLLIEIHPWAEMARFARTGGGSMAVAVRIARAATGREKVAICGYHGWHDWYLAANLASEDADGKTLDGHLLPGLQPAGVPASLKGTALAFTYNRLDELERVIAAAGGDLAAVVMETTRGIDPEPGFLEGVRQRCDRIGAKLIFDEISIGWRLCLGGAHLKLGVAPDMAVFAKTISNGYPMGAVIGNAHTMQAAQESFISSAYWTEGVGPAAALAAVRKMMRIDVPAHLERIGTRVMAGWRESADRHGLPITIGGRPQNCNYKFETPNSNALVTLATVRMLDRGFLSTGYFNGTLAHEDRHIEAYLAALDEAFAELKVALDAGDAESRIGGPVKHAHFARLVS